MMRSTSHLKSKHNEDANDARAFQLAQPTETENERKRKVAQLSIHNAMDIMRVYKFVNPTHDTISRSLIEMIALDNQPLRIFEDIEILRAMNYQLLLASLFSCPGVNLKR